MSGYKNMKEMIEKELKLSRDIVNAGAYGDSEKLQEKDEHEESSFELITCSIPLREWGTIPLGEWD